MAASTDGHLVNSIFSFNSLTANHDMSGQSCHSSMPTLVQAHASSQGQQGQNTSGYMVDDLMLPNDPSNICTVFFNQRHYER